jgi:hypothetical protein
MQAVAKVRRLARAAGCRLPRDRHDPESSRMRAGSPDPRLRRRSRKQLWHELYHGPSTASRVIGRGFRTCTQRAHERRKQRVRGLSEPHSSRPLVGASSVLRWPKRFGARPTPPRTPNARRAGMADLDAVADRLAPVDLEKLGRTRRPSYQPGATRSTIRRRSSSTSRSAPAPTEVPPRQR